MVWCDDHCSQAVQWDVWMSGVSASIRSEEVCISAGGLKAPELPELRLITISERALIW